MLGNSLEFRIYPNVLSLRLVNFLNLSETNFKADFSYFKKIHVSDLLSVPALFIQVGVELLR